MNLAEYIAQPIPTKQPVGSVKLTRNDVKIHSVTNDVKRRLEYHRLTINGFGFNYCVIDGSGILYRMGEDRIPDVKNPTCFTLDKEI